MVKVLNDNKVTAVVATLPDGEEVSLQYELKNPTFLDMLPGAGSAIVEELLDIGIPGKKGPQTLVKAFQLGMTSSTSGWFKGTVMEPAKDIAAAFREAGFNVPTVKTPIKTHILRAAHRVLGL